MRCIRWLVLMGLLGPGVAQGHGQFPLPLGTLLNGQGEDPLLVATFGILVPQQQPGYRWVCEETAGGALTSAVMWVRTSSGTLLGGSREGLFRYSTDLCSVTRPAGIPENARVRHLSVHPSMPWVALGLGDGTIRLSLDDGATFGAPVLTQGVATPIGNLFLPDTSQPSGIAAWRYTADARVELQQWTASASQTPVPVADTLATTWDFLALDGQRAGQMYVRENGDGHDRLLRVDAVTGQVTQVLLEAEDELVLGANRAGTKVAMGGLVTPLRVSQDSAATFTTRSQPSQTRGIAFGAQDTLYVAANNWADGFALARSQDLGGTWQGLGRFVDLQGVQVCPQAADEDGGVTSVARVCAPYWPALSDLFGIGVDAGVEAPDAGTASNLPPPASGCPLGLGGAWMGGMVVLLRRRHGR